MFSVILGRYVLPDITITREMTIENLVELKEEAIDRLADELNAL